MKNWLIDFADALALVTRKRQELGKDAPKTPRTQIDRQAIRIEAAMFQTLVGTRYGVFRQAQFARTVARALAERDKRIAALERALDAQRDLVATLEKSGVAGIR